MNTVISKSLILLLAGAALAAAAEKAPLVAEDSDQSSNIYRGERDRRERFEHPIHREVPVYRAPIVRVAPIFYAGRDRDYRVVVYYNPGRAAELSSQTRLFLTEHERARISLRFDLERRTEAEEYEADRLAVDVLRGTFSRRDWQVVLSDLDRFNREASRRLESVLLAERLI